MQHAAMMNGGLNRERFQNMIHRATQLRAQGFTEQNSPELAQMLQIIKAAQMKSMQQQQAAQPMQQLPAGPLPVDKPHLTNGAPVPDDSVVVAAAAPQPPAATLSVSPAQMTILRAQVQALQYISRNQVVPNHIQRVIYDPDSTDPSRNPHESLAYRSADRLRKQMAGETDTTTEPATDTGVVFPNGPFLERDESSGIYPYNALATPESELATVIETKKTHNTLIPSLMPKGLDPHQIMAERQRFIDARIENRIQELSSLSSTIPDSAPSDLITITTPDDPSHPPMSSTKLRALIELKALKLRDKQRALRSSVVARLTETSSLTLDRKQFRRLRKPTLKDARSIESLERRQREDREKRAKQKHLDYLASICAHGQALIATGRAQSAKAQRLGQAVLRFHVETEKEEQKRVERISRERLKALKADDEEAYMKLIDTAKDTRITHLLRQTDTYLDSLAQAVSAQQNEANARRGGAALPVAVGGTDETTFGAQKMDDEDAGGDGEKKKNKVDYYSVAHRIAEKVTVQPKLLVGGTLKEYQLKGLQWMISLYNNHLNGILADEMGLGKTIQTISLCCYLLEVKREPGPFLIIVPLSTLTNWVHEFRKWAPQIHVIVYNGSPAVRKTLQPQIRQGGFQVLITTFEYIIREKAVLSKIRWLHMIIDEGHRMKNTQSKLSQTLTQFYSTRYRLILTGTPLQNNLPELWSLLNFVLPKIFNSVTSFEEWFNTPFANAGTGDKLELNEEETLLVIRRLHKVLRPFLLRRLKKDVESELPDKVEKVVKCKMSALQYQLDQQMKKHGILFDEEVKGKQTGIKGLNNTIMQLRKICQHPFVFDKIEDRINPSGKLNDSIIRSAGKVALLDQLLPKLFATGHRVLMFFQMTQIMDILADYFNYRGFKHFRLDGGTKPEERTNLLVQFNDPKTDVHLFMLSTRAGGLGLNLQTADTVIIYDSDWNPHADLQAQDRAHRIGQKNDVRILRFITERSIEEIMLARARSKLDMDGKVIQAGRFDNKSTAEEQEEYLRSLLESGETEDTEESASMNDEEINLLVARSEDEMEIFRKMDIERAGREEREWVAAGNTLPVPPRLMTIEELPEIYQRDEPLQMDDDVENLLSGRGARARNVVRYTDGMTDDQWAEALEDGTLDEPFPTERKARAAAGSSKKAPNRIESSPEMSDPGNDDDEWGGGGGGGGGGSSSRRAAPASSTKRGRGRPRNGSPATGTPVGNGKRKRGAAASKQPSPSPSLDDEEDMIPESKRRKTAAAATPAAKSGGGDGITPAIRERMKKAFGECYRAVQQCTSEEGRQRCELFRELPSRKDYADYYFQIQRPIAMSIIRKRSATSHYKSMQQYADDWRLMFNNARQYNQEGSLVVADANALQAVFEGEFKRQTEGTDLPGVGDPSGEGQGSMQPQGVGQQQQMMAMTPAQPPPSSKKKKKVQEYSDDDYGSD